MGTRVTSIPAGSRCDCPVAALLLPSTVLGTAWRWHAGTKQPGAGELVVGQEPATEFVFNQRGFFLRAESSVGPGAAPPRLLGAHVPEAHSSICTSEIRSPLWMGRGNDAAPFMRQWRCSLSVWGLAMSCVSHPGSTASKAREGPAPASGT